MHATRWLVLTLFLSAPCAGQKYVDIRVRPGERAPTLRWEREPMADPNRWLGGTVWNTTTAWHLGSIPTTGERAAFTYQSHDSVLAGHTTGVAGPAQIDVHPEYLGDIGSPGAGYNLSGLSVVTWRGPGKLYLSPDSGDSTDVIIDNDNAIVVIDTQVRHILIKAAASVEVLSTCSFTGELQCYSATATVTIRAIAAAQSIPQNLDMHSGKLLNYRATTTAVNNVLAVGAAEVYQYGLLESNTNVRLKGGVLKYEPSSTPAAKQPDLFLTAGVFDASGSLFTIPVGTFIKGPDAVVLGSVSEGVGSWADYDLTQDWPATP